MKVKIIILFLLNGLNSIASVNSQSIDTQCEISLKDSIKKLLEVSINVASEFKLHKYRIIEKFQDEYDFIIIGAGPAGCILANRLSENSNYSILLLEAGNVENPTITNIPMGAPSLQSTSFNWGYQTEPQKRACLSMNKHRCNWPHGRGLGGSSIINYMIYTRGNRLDFDRWSTAVGDDEWSYDKMQPFFENFENWSFEPNRSQNKYKGEGSLTIEYPRFRTSVADAFVSSAKDANYSEINYNSGDQIGVSYLHSSTKSGWRQSAAKAFLAPIKSRPNLHIATRSWATKLIVDDTNGDDNATTIRIGGVNFVHNKRNYFVRARKEVILSAGAFESPKLLMLSGIGPEEHLNEMKIPLIKDLPVGQTLYEHMAVYGPIFLLNNLTDGLLNTDSVLGIDSTLEFFEGKGPLTSTGIEALLYMKTNNSDNNDSELPDIELLQSFATVGFDQSQGTRLGIGLNDDTYKRVFQQLGNRRAFQILPMLLHPKSRGYLKLKSRNPFHHPVLYSNFFDNPNDIEILLAGIREIIRIVDQKPFKLLGAELFNITIPGCESNEFNTDDYWRCFIMHLSATLHHQVSTCKMGSIDDNSTIVDAQLRVHGILNLRVADVSILPDSPSGHTAALSFLIGEKAADLIKKNWKNVKNNQRQINETNVMRAKREPIVDWLDDGDVKEIITSTETNFPMRGNLPVFDHVHRMRKIDEELNSTMSLAGFNVSIIREQSKEFENQTIGDIGLILWGQNQMPPNDDKTNVRLGFIETKQKSNSIGTSGHADKMTSNLTTTKSNLTTTTSKMSEIIMETTENIVDDDTE